VTKNKILRIDSRKEFNNLKIYQAPDILQSLNAFEYLGRDDRACLLEPGNDFYFLYVDSRTYAFGWSAFLCRIRFYDTLVVIFF
jgi:hypothetical protein